MTPERYVQIREIYFRVQEVPPNEQQHVLEQACGSDNALRAEVESLLGSMTKDAKVSSSTLWFPAMLRRRRIGIIGIGIMLLISIGLGEFIRLKIRNEAENEIKDQLLSSLTMRHDAIDSWVNHRFSELKKLAQDPLIRHAIQELNTLARQENSALALADALEQKVLHGAILHWLKTSNYTHYAVWNLNFTVISSDDQVFIGRRVAPETEVLSSLAQLSLGQPSFMPRRRYGSGVGGHPEIAPEHISVVGVPVMDDQGKVIAGLILAQDARENLDHIISLGRWKSSGEQYIFNAQGMLLSEPRSKEELTKIGLIQSFETPALNLRLLNPGGNLLSGEASFGAKESWPLTLAVAKAISAGKEMGSEQKSGVLLTPYRDMRGVEVVGAWMWDSKLNFGLVSEIAAREVFFMANAVDAGIRIMYGLTLVVVLISVGMMRQTHPRLTMGSRFGPYKLLKRIGEGGLGEVFLAQHELMKRFAAIKILRADAHNRDCISLFEREVQATSLLSHPNTVAIYDFGRATDGRLFYAMEFLSGLSLAKLLSMEPQLPVPRVVHFLIQIISSLREAHHIGLVHRDIKPLNIMICRKGCEYDVVKVLDFGLVKPLKSEALPEIILSSSKGLYGTPLFMAPECLQDPAACDVRVDIYALGVVAYRMLSGQNPFSSTHELALMYDVLFTEPEPLYQLKPDLDHDLAALVMRCLAKDPELRPQSMDELREHFSQFKANWVWTNEDAWNWWKGHAEHLNEINPGPLSSNVRIEG